MTLEKVFEKAYLEMINEWGVFNEAYEEMPTEINKVRADRKWNELKELEKMAQEMGISW